MTNKTPAVIGGQYRVVRCLGQGGMGSVYEAHTPQGQRVAVKVIATELANNPTLVGRFEREARAVSAIDTPHIAKAFDAGTDPETGRPFLVMEFLEGEDLDQVLKRLGALPVDLSLRIAAQACMALEKAHEARFLHRDIKPANLFVTREGGGHVVKLLDFGVAKVKPEVTRSASETAGLTRTGSMLGSPLYMSPEQARGYKDIDFRSDLWSLGVVLYKMLSGRTPHAETEELGELIVLICTEPPEPLQDIAPWVPAEVAAVVHRALRFSPGERYRSAAEMLAALQALLPGGASIAEGMIRPLSETEKVRAAPRLAADLTDAPPPRKGAITGAPVPHPPAQPPPQPPPPAIVTHDAVVSPSAPAPGFPAAASPPRRSAWPWVAVAVTLVLTTVGVLALRFATPLFPAGAQGSGAATTTGTADVKPRTVTVVVLPPTASVEVDGVKAALTDGVLEITGAVGSVHKVHVTAGSAEKNVRVVVSESGAVPPKIEVESAEPAPTVTATATTAAGAPIKPRPKPTASPTAAPSSDELRNKR